MKRAVILCFLLTIVASFQIGDVLAFESYNFKGHFMRPELGEIWIDPYEDTQAFKDDITWKIVDGLCGAMNTISFESVKYSGSYLRRKGSSLWLGKPDGTDSFNQEACFISGQVFVAGIVPYYYFTNQIFSDNDEEQYIYPQEGKIMSISAHSMNFSVDMAIWIGRLL